MFDHIDFAVVDQTVSRKFYETVLAALGIEPFMDIKTEEGREGTGYGSLTGEQFWIGKHYFAAQVGNQYAEVVVDNDFPRRMGHSERYLSHYGCAVQALERVCKALRCGTGSATRQDVHRHVGIERPARFGHWRCWNLYESGNHLLRKYLIEKGCPFETPSLNY